MNDANARASLLSLPEPALIALLGSSDLAVAEESTVAVVAVRWAQQRGMDVVPDAVASCVRIMRLKPGFIEGVTHLFPQWTPAVLALASACADSYAAHALLQRCGHCPAVLHVASGAPRRASAVSLVRFTAAMPLEELGDVFAQAVQQGKDTTTKLLGGAFCAGYRWYVSVKVCAGPGHAVQVGVIHHLDVQDWRNAVQPGIISYNASIACPARQRFRSPAAALLRHSNLARGRPSRISAALR
eukprot:TRINITY_DN12453_c0_g1_i1.p1 TRINITY_DN12453_c0_g1~~TRINITY_DN12453_c0_g1_i1.p1  ORF type:complete len:243 (+),score=85.72 TRINITY_DN12453_c0_g1_i1:751-1479(+)